MFTTLFLLLLVAFRLWYVTSKQYRPNNPPQYLRSLMARPVLARVAGAVLVALVTVAFVVKLGWVTGILAGFVALMGAGSLVVALSPFRYITAAAASGLYAFFLILELLL